MVSPRDTLAKAKTLMEAGGFRRLPVVEGGRLVGIITERDLRQHIGYLDATRVDGAMSGTPMTVPPYSSVQDAARLLLQHKIGGLPVVEGGRLVGIITERDLRQHIGYLDATRVDGAMSPTPMTVPPHSSVQDAARLLLQHKVGGLPVVEDGKLVGIMTTSDLLKALLEVIEATEEILDG